MSFTKTHYEASGEAVSESREQGGEMNRTTMAITTTTIALLVAGVLILAILLAFSAREESWVYVGVEELVFFIEGIERPTTLWMYVDFEEPKVIAA